MYRTAHRHSRALTWAAVLVVALALVALSAGAQGGGRSRAVVLPADMQSLVQLSAVAGRPTEQSAIINVLSATGGQAVVQYGMTAGQLDQQTGPVACTANVPVEIPLTGLRADTSYTYRVQVAAATTAAQYFHTARPPGSTFTFEIQGDSHPERPQMFDPTLYAQTLRAAGADRPDFYLTSGDDFSVDTLQNATAETVSGMYRTQRWFLSLVGAPLFLVNGNHEQAALCNLDGTANNVAVWAGTSRNGYFPLPGPDSFYTGDTKPVPHIGLLRDYYAWTWGDALFVVLDPYWHSTQPVDNIYGQRDKGQRDLWNATLGEDQYQWLRQTLADSRAKYKFVFAHHVLGTGRGGIEGAPYFEWGGLGRNGVTEFAERRPGWELPVHQLMVKYGVTIFFQGHDHIFVKQQLDGVIYQSLPLPGDPYYALHNRSAYRSGEAFPGSGRVRVTVAPDKVSVAYVRSYLPKDESPERKSEEVACSYEVTASH